jgi:hypothetical protein
MVDAIVYYIEIVVLGEKVFVDQVHPSLLWVGTLLLAVFNKA